MREGYLISKIPVKAKLISSQTKLAKVLGSYLWLRQTREGSNLVYIFGEERKDCFYTVEFSKSLISLTIHSKSSPLYYSQEALLRILSLLSALEDIYEPDIRSLYPYLVNLVASVPFYQLSEKLSSRREGAESESDIMLAKRINVLLAENEDIKAKVEKSRLKLRYLLSSFLLLKYGNTINIETVAKDTNIDKEEIEEMLGEMKEFGYKGIKIGEGRFSLARI